MTVYEYLNTKDTLNGDIIISINSSMSIIKIAKISDQIKKVYEDLLSKNYVYYKHQDNNHYFKKRESFLDIYHLAKENIIQIYENIMYQLDSNKVNKKLLVIFSPHSSPENLEGPSVYYRYFPKYFSDIKRFVKDDVAILRIADFNLSNGSFYRNTSNFLDYEEKIQKLIVKIIKDLKLSKKKTLLYGAGKGGSGAVYHSLKGDYNFLAVDPFIHLYKGDVNRAKSGNLENFLAPNLMNGIDKELVKFNKYGKIITSSNVEKNYRLIINTFNDTNVEIINDTSFNIKKHNDISKETKYKQIVFLNSFLEEIN